MGTLSEDEDFETGVERCRVCGGGGEECLCSTPSSSSTTCRPRGPRRRGGRGAPGGGGAPQPRAVRRQLFREAEEPPPSTSSSSARPSCRACDRTFPTLAKLHQHSLSHTGEKPFRCGVCEKAFSSKFKLVRHGLIHSDKRQYVCAVCQRTFHRKDHLKNHAKVHSPVKWRYKCERENCGKEYSSPLSLRKHLAGHAAEDGNLECKICGRVFSTKEEIVFHLKVHAGSRTVKTPADKKYRCEFCGRKFFTGKDVRRHNVVHTGRRDFLCQFCPQRFGRKDHLVRHVKKSHTPSTSRGKKGKKCTRAVAAIIEETQVQASTSGAGGEEFPEDFLLSEVKDEGGRELEGLEFPVLAELPEVFSLLGDAEEAPTTNTLPTFHQAFPPPGS